MRASKTKPIYGTDFSVPLSVMIERTRSDIARVRGQLNDIGSAFPGWKQDMEMVEGLLTCGLVTLHWVMEGMQKQEKSEAAVTAGELGT
jgi:hypothetical protein